MFVKLLKKYLLIGLGILSLVLGVIGIFLPVLPTTPFLLLSSFCFLRSSKRLYTWLINHKVLGIYIYNYITYKSVKANTKVFALVFLWVSMIISISIVPFVYIKILLVAIATGVTIHILSLKTLDIEEIKKQKINSIKSNENK